MKIALYIEDGREQVVLTPQTATERAILGKLHDGSRSINVYRGAFYACQGGWTRQRDASGFGGTELRPQSDEQSTIIVLDQKAAES